MTDTQVLYANIGSNVVALLMLLAAWRWRNVGRFLFFTLFLWAAQINMRTAIGNPDVYLEYARWAVQPYRQFILGPFARHAGIIVGAIAAGQLAIALLVAWRGRAVTFGLTGAIIFLLAIAPLGKGSAFPFSLTTSLAAVLLLRHGHERTLAGELVTWIRRRRRGGPSAIGTGLLIAVVAFLTEAPRAVAADDLKELVVILGPVTGAANSTRTLVFDSASRRQVTRFDVQDGREHNLRGITLLELLARTKAPRSVDAVVFTYTDGMEIPVQLRDMEEVEEVFIALEHGNVMDQFSDVYPLHNAAEIPCPKVVYSRPITSFSIWRYPTQLATVRLVTWKAYEAMLAQATRRVPDRSGWPLYLQHCQSCHGIGGNGAKRGPDFLSDMAAYRRVPALAVTDVSQPPSLHEKVKGFTDGKMPVLNHISNKDITVLWRWLHAIHAGATK